MKNIFVSKTKENKKRAYSTAITGTVNGATKKATLIFPSETVASTKAYKYDPTLTLYSGNKVLIRKEAGTYVICGKLYN